MFTSRNELNQATKTQSSLVSKQLELQSRQQAEIYRLKLAQEEQARAKEVERKKLEEMLAREKQVIETMEEQKAASSPPVVEPIKRKKWDRPPEIELELLATQNESNNSSEDETHLTVARKLRAPSRGSSVSEFFSLSEGEDDDLSPIQQAVREENEAEDLDDPDAAFAAMCIALARRKQQAEPELPVDDMDETIELEDDLDLSNSAGSIRRSFSEPGWISESLDPAAHPTSPARRSGSFDGENRCKSPDVPAELQIFPPLSNSFFSSAL